MNTRVVSNSIKLRLHYWNIRGRVQAVRYMLEDIAHKHENVDYKETFEPVNTMMSTWAKRKSDQTVSGPFRTLPVLHWNDSHTFSQSLTIGLFKQSTIEFFFLSWILCFRTIISKKV